MMAKGSVTKSLKHSQRKQAISECKRLDEPDQPKYIIYRKLKFWKKSKTKAPVWEFNGILPKFLLSNKIK